ncbi:hypothetical protein CHELA20_11023 [Hyphomicrobiales bacterium]|nr:hypothetical protein CHELA20_11023 [Hyphomicrobiales bacterium]CAH1694662.1 hypothetical protein CHELA41_51254 [Hyphomicrobiales bacterium]
MRTNEINRPTHCRNNVLSIRVAFRMVGATCVRKVYMRSTMAPGSVKILGQSLCRFLSTVQVRDPLFLAPQAPARTLHDPLAALLKIAPVLALHIVALAIRRDR